MKNEKNMNFKALGKTTKYFYLLINQITTTYL